MLVLFTLLLDISIGLMIINQGYRFRNFKTGEGGGFVSGNPTLPYQLLLIVSTGYCSPLIDLMILLKVLVT